MLPITQSNGTVNTTGCAVRKPQYIVIHYTAGTTSRGGTAISVANYFRNPAAKASADFIVDDTTIVQYNGMISSRYTWAVGGAKQTAYGGTLHRICTNANSISIEICSGNSTKQVTKVGDRNWYFTEAALRNALDLTKYLMQKYAIKASNVIRHYDVSGKICPGVYGWTGYSGSETAWNNFKAKLTGAVTAPQQTPTTQTQNVEDTPMVELKKGSQGRAVKLWQVIVGANVDGDFGVNTDKATREWQRNHKDINGHALTVDGIVGPKSWAAGLRSV